MKQIFKFINKRTILVISVVLLSLIFTFGFKINIIAYDDIALKQSKNNINNCINNSESCVIYIDKYNNSKIMDLLENANENVYYINLENEKTILEYNNDSVNILREGSNFYKQLLEKLSYFASVYELKNNNNELINTGYNTIVEPFVTFVSNGKIVYSHTIQDLYDNNYKNSIKEGIEYLNDYQSKYYLLFILYFFVFFGKI